MFLAHALMLFQGFIQNKPLEKNIIYMYNKNDALIQTNILSITFLKVF